MRRRRFLEMTAGAGVAGLASTGCGGGALGSGSSTLRLVAAEYGQTSGLGVSDTKEYWTTVAEAFHEEYPEIEIDVSVLGWQDANIEVARMVEDGEAPDIAHISAFADLAAAGELYPANELLTIPQLADVIPSIARAGDVEHVQYGMPFTSVTWRLYYNRELFEQAGLDPDRPPRDWNELLQAAAALFDSGVRVPFGLPLGHEEAYSEAALWMISGGGGITDSASSYAIDSPANVATFSWLRDELVATGFNGGSQPAAVRRGLAYTNFVAGLTGMILGDPLLGRLAREANLPYGTASLPGREGPVRSTLGEASWILALNQRGNIDEISTFLRYVFDPRRAASFAEQFELLPVTVGATQEMTQSGEPEHLLPFLDELETAAFHPVGKSSWSRVAASISESISQAVQLDGNVANVLGDIQWHAMASGRESRK